MAHELIIKLMNAEEWLSIELLEMHLKRALKEQRTKEGAQK